MKSPNPRPGTSGLPPGFAMTQRDTDKHDLTKRVGPAVPAGRLPFAPSCLNLRNPRRPQLRVRTTQSTVLSLATDAKRPDTFQTHFSTLFHDKTVHAMEIRPIANRKRSMLDHRNSIFAMLEPFYILTRYDTLKHDNCPSMGPKPLRPGGGSLHSDTKKHRKTHQRGRGGGFDRTAIQLSAEWGQ